jgi:signal peptidase II
MKTNLKQIFANEKNMTIAIISIIIIAIDQITKYIVTRNMELSESIPLIKNIIHITYVQNAGAGFGILQHQQLIFITLSVMIIFLVAYYYKKIPDSGLNNTILGLIIAGTIGNLIDRIMFGYVIDFIDFQIWPVFNIADSCLTIAAILLAYYFIKK